MINSAIIQEFLACCKYRKYFIAYFILSIRWYHQKSYSKCFSTYLNVKFHKVVNMYRRTDVYVVFATMRLRKKGLLSKKLAENVPHR